MSFYAAYNIQADFPGAEVHNDTLEVYPNAESFLNALKDYIRYVRFLALDNDPDRISDNPWEEEFFQEYIKIIDERLSDPTANQQLDLDSFDVYDVQISISKATSDLDTFFYYVSSCMYEIFGSGNLMDSGDEDNEEDDDSEDEEDQDEEDGDFSDDNPLMQYCAKITASGDKPDPKTFRDLINDYMAGINSEALSLVDIQEINESNDSK